MNCRHCGSDRTQSQGRSMKCIDCGKTFVKIPRRNTLSPEDRPPCPDCGSPNPYAASLLRGVRRWSCRVCGRSYKDTPKIGKVELPILEVQVE